MAASDFATSSTSVLGLSGNKDKCHGRSKVPVGELTIPRMAPFVHAMDVAFNNHLPLELSPDGMLLVITQRFSQHINKHSDKCIADC